jgi:ABC-type Fe3+ transport system substrate-binding protein
MTAKVRQMISNSSGNPVANQFIIYASDGNYFQSYNSVIAFKGNDGKITLDHYYWDYSRTTGKYRNQFLGEGIADTRAKIESGEYELADLN